MKPERPYKKRSIPQATRRAVALAAGAVPGETVEAACHYCPTVGLISWRTLWSTGKPGLWVSFPGLELEHVVPESLGGPSTPDNIVLACRPCNRGKGTKVYGSEEAALVSHVR